MFLETLTTLLAMSRSTNLATRFTGVGKFLPALSPKRFSLVGGIDDAIIRRQMDMCTSFKDDDWVNFWTGIAFKHVKRLDVQLKKEDLGSVRDWLEARTSVPPPSSIQDFLGRGVKVLTHTPIGNFVDINDLIRGEAPEVCTSIIGVEAVMKAIAYLFLAAWPGRTPKRTDAYKMSSRLFDLLLDSTAPVLNLVVERHILQSEGEAVTIYGLLPKAMIGAEHRGMAAMLVSNGLEGTNAESIMPFLRSKHLDNVALFFIEMPGTYAYNSPMRVGVSEKIYSDAISYISSHQHIDSSRIGMMGLSFGGNWTTRMAICEPRLKAIIVNGAPLGRSLGVLGAYGMPQIMLDALVNVTGAKSVLFLSSKLHTLIPLPTEIQSIKCPVLAINGANDTLVSSQDTTDLARYAPISKIKLYANDDHCAMSHVRDWMQLSMEWTNTHLVSAKS